MGRAPCCSKVGLHRGPWAAKEDKLLVNYIQAHGEGHWRSLPKRAGLLRCGKSCRLRWLNYLRPDIKRGNITPDEDDLIIRLHSLLGNRWSLIAKRLPGRTDNEIKNYWNSHLRKRVIKKSETNSKTSKEASTGSNRKANKTTEKKQKNKDKPESSTAITPSVTITKVHQPKAIRVSPFSVITRNGSFDSMISGSSSSCGSEGNRGANDIEVFDFPAYYYSGKAMVCDEDYQEFHYNNGFETAATFLDATAVEDDGNMLDDIFEEYQQLLKGDYDHCERDSVFDSLLI